MRRFASQSHNRGLSEVEARRLVIERSQLVYLGGAEVRSATSKHHDL